MKILVVGHSIVDRFEGAENELPKPGGVYYSALGLLSAAKPSDEIYLLTSWNEKSFQIFERVYSRVNLSLATCVESLPEVILKTSGAGEREEEYKNLSGQLDIRCVHDWNIFDGILINMITGFDISLEQLQTIRKKFNGLIYLDVHTLARGISANMKREFRPIPDASLWLKNIDVVQANENEIKTLDQSVNEMECAANICSMGPKLLIVTKGSLGAHVYFKNESEVESIFMKGEHVSTVNKVGCGDIFGAGFFYFYISTREIELSLKLANKAGAIAASSANLTEILKLDLNDQL
ncbi:MAG: carbohydrate kinase family protein [Bacteroidetes bacterium]|nr:carbohydrate kinase family protein [Bacteroidota bacterium]